MSEVRFPICGSLVPEMVGRKAQLEEVRASLLKATPDHLSIVGPKLAGKTVFLHGLKKLLEAASPFHHVIYWDLGHHVPQSNDEFIAQMGIKLAEACSDYADFLRVPNLTFADLKEVVGNLEQENLRILWLWDGFDKPLKVGGQLTRNLWDNLRDLFQSPAFKLITASRKPLSEVLRDENSVTSDFWRIFNPSPVRIGIFSEDDLNVILAKDSRLRVNKGALTEINNWTGSWPIFALAVVNQLKNGDVDNVSVNTAANRAQSDVRPYLDHLWDDLSTDEQAAYQHILDTETNASGIHVEIRKSLEERGLVKRDGALLKSCCRFMMQVKDSRVSVSLIQQMFTGSQYEANLVKVIELRYKALPRLDDRLRRHLGRCIEDLADSPSDAMKNLRAVVECCFDLIWVLELGAEKKIPVGWASSLSSPEREWALQERLPVERKNQMRLIKIFSGMQGADMRRFMKIGLQECAILDSLYTLQNFGQHQNVEGASFGLALSTIMLMLDFVELVAIKI